MIPAAEAAAPLLHVVLYRPEIPPNTGNVIRLCANTASRLHLIRPLGFSLEDAKLKRAGLDYREWASVQEYDSLDGFIKAVGPARMLAFSTRGTTDFHDIRYQHGDALLFGPETRGLPAALLVALPPERIARIPMVPGNRSLNLSNAVAVVVYEAWRQLGFAGSA